MTDINDIITLLDDMQSLADFRVQEIVGPDNWSVYSDLCDLIYLAKKSAFTLLQEQEARSTDKQRKMVKWDDLER